MTDDRTETITDPAEIRATDEPDERGDFPCCTTPAPVGAGLDLDALHETICDHFTGMAEVRQAADALVAEVRRSRETVAVLQAEVERLEGARALLLQTLDGTLGYLDAVAVALGLDLPDDDEGYRSNVVADCLLDHAKGVMARVEAVRALHVPMTRAGVSECRECLDADGRNAEWPCETVAAIGGER